MRGTPAGSGGEEERGAAVAVGVGTECASRTEDDSATWRWASSACIRFIS